MSKRPGWWLVLASAATFMLAILPTTVRADVAPGDKITDQNIDKVKDLISPGMEWCIKHGWPITITETKRIEWPKAYKEATEKYASQVKLTPDGLNILNYVAGLPFPNVDPKDPQVAMKIMWNWGYTYLTTDDVDSYYGYSGHVAWMDFKFLGERDLLSCYHAEHYPVKWHDKVDWAFDEKWEKRRVYVIEGISKLPQYAYGKRVIFVDKEAWVIPYSDIYDRSGELWKIWLNDMSFKKKAFEGATSIEYPDEMGFIPAIVMVDMQLEHATKASLPSPRFPGEQGWYFNQGVREGVIEDWFNVSSLVHAVH